MSNLCVIPARGGSKRIPRKNIRSFAGRPIIAWSIEAAHKSNCFSRVVVSTEDPEISKVAQRYGAEVPMLRPSELATDTARAFTAVSHVLDWCSEQNEVPRHVCCLYATAPFVRPDTILSGLELLETDNVDFVIPVTAFEFPILRSLKMDERSRLVVPTFPEMINSRSQDLDEHFHDAGQFYWGKPQSFLQHETLFSSLSIHVAAVRVPSVEAQDIDTEEDWQRAEALFALFQHSDQESERRITGAETDGEI